MVMEPVQFVPSQVNTSSLILVDNVLYTSTTNDCAGAPNAVWAIDLGIFGWDEEGGHMKIETLHRGASFTEVSAKTGFAFLPVHGETFGTTAAPTEEELYWVRKKLDPRGIRCLESNAGGDAPPRGLWAAVIDSDRRFRDIF